MLEVARGGLQVGFPVGTIRLPRRQPKRPTPVDPEKGAPLLKLMGIAVLGWFGLMLVVTVLAL